MKSISLTETDSQGNISNRLILEHEINGLTDQHIDMIIKLFSETEIETLIIIKNHVQIS